jgi:hypothetical protein
MSLSRDLRHAIRQLVRTPGFTLVAVLTLALGIGATTAIFSVVNGVLLRPLPYPDAHALVRVNEYLPAFGRFSVAPANFLDWRQQNTGFERMAAYGQGSGTFMFPDGPERLAGLSVSCSSSLPASQCFSRPWACMASWRIQSASGPARSGCGWRSAPRPLTCFGWSSAGA